MRLLLAALGLAWGTVIGAGTAGAQCANYENYMHWMQDIDAGTSYVRGIETAGDVVYTVAMNDLNSGLLSAYDISNPGKARLLGELTMNGNYHYGRGAVSGTNLFLISDNPRQMHTVDISAPEQLQQTATINMTEAPLDIAVSGSHAYVTASTRMYCFDISAPTAPSLAGTVFLPSAGRKIEAAGNHAYIHSEQSGLLVFDISDPENPQSVGSLLTYEGWQGYQGNKDLALSGSTIYMPLRETGKVYMIDVQVPAEPQLIASVDLVNFGFIDIAGDLAYVVDDYGTSVLDISSTTNLEYLGWVPYSSYGAGWSAVDIVTAGPFAFLAFGRYQETHQDIEVFALGSPCDRGIISSLDTPGTAESVIVQGDYAYVADGAGGLRIIDVSDPLHPTAVGSYDTPGYAAELVLSGDLAFVADGVTGLQILDVTNRAGPVLIGATATAHSALALAIADSLVYIADSDSGLTVINVSDPAEPAVFGRLDTSGRAQGIAVSGAFAYLADGSGGLRAIDRNADDPAEPWIIGGVKSFTVNDARDVVIDGTMAYVADADSGLYVIDIFDPANPAPLGETATQDAATDVFVSASYAYVSDGEAGMKLINVQAPDEPYVAGNLAIPSSARGVFAEQYYTFIAAADSGLQIAPSQCGYAEYPTAYFNLSASVAFRPAQITFTDNSTGFITGYDWDFGDGSAHSTAVSPAHLYTAPGDYAVTLTVTSPETSDSMVRPVTIVTEAPYITSVADVPADQGGYVYVDFHKSYYDDTEPSLSGPDKNVEMYTIQRLDDGRWITVATSGAYGDRYYSVLSNTQGDGPETWATQFRVIAHMNEGIWIGPSASGFSADNIAPAAPTGLAWLGDRILSWSPVAASDLAYYKIYAGPSAAFGESAPCGATIETQIDLSGVNQSWVFVVAVDDADLESAPSIPSAVTGAPDVVTAPELLAALPNPFNPSTTIRYALPVKSRARLAIYDISGRLIKMLVDAEIDAGHHRVAWEGEDHGGRQVPSGVYFSRLETGGVVLTGRMTLIK
ncbi:MAG: PKD domain-containing protein [Candidatus Latescibacteria bacterium]|nr:PKD domain-containing protein [Candidatus Latescibacterota bacterium]